MAIQGINGHAASDMLPPSSDASQASPMSFPAVGNADPQAIMNLKTQSNLSGANV